MLILADLLKRVPLVHSQYSSTLMALEDVAALGGLRVGPSDPGAVRHVGCRNSSLGGITITVFDGSATGEGVVGFASDLIKYGDEHINDLLAVFGPSLTVHANALSVLMASATFRDIPWFTFPDHSDGVYHVPHSSMASSHFTLKATLEDRVDAAFRMIQRQPAFAGAGRFGLVHLADADLGSAVAFSVHSHIHETSEGHGQFEPDSFLARLIAVSPEQSMSSAMEAIRESGLFTFFVGMGLQGTEPFLRAAQVAGLTRDAGYLFIFLQDVDEKVRQCSCADGHLWLGQSGPGNEALFQEYVAEVIGSNSSYMTDALRVTAPLGPAGGSSPTVSDAVAIDQVRAFFFALNYTLSIAGLDPYSDEGRKTTLWALAHLHDLPAIEYATTKPGVAPPSPDVSTLQVRDKVVYKLDDVGAWGDEVLGPLLDYRPDSCAGGPLLYRDPELRSCLPCPAGLLNVPGDDRDECEACEIGSVLSGSTCVPCPLGSSGFLRDDGVADCDDGIDILVLLVTILSLTIVCALVCIPFRLMQLRREQDLALAVVAKEREAVDYRSRFLSVVSHELRSPLQIVTLNAEMLSERWDEGNTDPTVLARYVKGILSASTTLKRCVNQLLDLFKLESMSSGQANLAELDLREVCESCTTAVEVETLSGGKDVELFTFIDSDDLHINVVGDEGHLRQVLMNLLHNAVKFTETGYVCLMVKPTAPPSHVRGAGRVDNSVAGRLKRLVGFSSPPSASARDDSSSRRSFREGIEFAPTELTDMDGDGHVGWWRISVIDTGCGVAKEQETRLFKEFSQVQGHTVNRLRVEHGGTGLGLFISRRITTYLGGTIRYRPNSPEGSIFELKLPMPVAAVPTDKRIVPMRLPTLARAQVGDSRLLIACKVPELSEAISMMADRMLPGITVLAATNAMDLTTLARKLPEDARVMVLAEEDMFNPTLLHALASRHVYRVALRDAFADGATSTAEEESSSRWIAKPLTASVLRSLLYTWQTERPAPGNLSSSGRASRASDTATAGARRKPRKRGRRTNVPIRSATN